MPIRHSRAAVLALSSVGLFAGLLLSQPAKPKKVALVVGVNKYKHADLNKPKALEFAEADAKDLAKELLGGGYDEVVVLVGADATREGIRKKLEVLRKAPGDGGVLLVALAGHGLQPEKSDDAYFCPYDADQRVVPAGDPNPRDPWDYNTMVPLAEILSHLKASTASTRVLMVDACRNDPASGRGRGVGSALRSGDLPDNTAVMLSCSRGQRAFEHKEFGAGHGAFFHHVLVGLRDKGRDKKGRVTADSLWDYVRDAVPEGVTAVIKDGAEQKPFRLVAGDVDFQMAAVLPKRDAPTGGVTPNGGIPAGKTKPSEETVKELGTRGLKRLDSTKGPVPAKEVKEIQSAWADELGLKHLVSIDVAGNAMEFVLVPPGAFMMGSQRRVIIEKPFLMGVCEVRQSEYAAIESSNPAWFRKKGGVENKTELVTIKSTDDFPVESVTWENAQDFAAKLLKTIQNKVPNAKAVRLPSEAEWEYAGRAGATTPFQNDEKQLNATAANFDKRLKRTEKCGQFAANPLGLRDTHGNVAEWCLDGYLKTLGNFEVTDPVEEAKGERVVRGGSWMDGPNDCAFSSRVSYRPDSSSNSIGFRVVIVLDVKK